MRHVLLLGLLCLAQFANGQEIDTRIMKDLEASGYQYTVEKTAGGQSINAMALGNMYENEFSVQIFKDTIDKVEYLKIGTFVSRIESSDTILSKTLMVAMFANYESVCGHFYSYLTSDGGVVLICERMIETAAYRSDSFKKLLDCMKSKVRKWQSMSLSGLAPTTPVSGDQTTRHVYPNQSR